MGSRLKPNHGGSGLPHTRIGRPAPQPKKAASYGPIASTEELERYLDAPKIACLLCGEEFVMLGLHVSKSHSMSSYGYKVMFNIPVQRSISGADLRERKKNITKKCWEDNPKMEHVRTALKKNISNLDGHKHRTKSVLPDRNYTRRKKGSAEITKYRDRYIKTLKTAIEFKRNLANQCSIDGYPRGKVRLYVVNNPFDKEAVGLFKSYKDLMAELHEKSLSKPSCSHCAKIFQRPPSHVSRSENVYCSKKCQDIAKRKRIKTNCVTCEKPMLQTPSTAKSVVTCSKECSSIRRKKGTRRDRN